MGRIRYLSSGVLIATITALFYGCGHWAYKEELPAKPRIITELIQEEPPLVDGILICNPDIITQLYERSENLLSEIWKTRENIDQMLFPIRNVYREGLHPEDYHLSAIEKLAEKIVLSDEVETEDIAKLELMLTDAFLLLSAHLAEKNLKVLRKDGSEVDPSSIDWNIMVTTGFPYRIHQEPGPKNALGRVKFMFPNQYSVYLHDTPNRNLFGRTDRSFSSGCIRVNNSLDLAAWLMKDNPAWNPAQIKNVIDQGMEQTVNLANPIQVHILYLTAWASDDGVVYFRKDIYDRDQPLLAALKQAPPGTDQ